MYASKWLGLAILFGFALTLSAQQPATPAKKKEPPKKSKLETLIDQALRNNPDIRVAEAKVREAQAELYKTRLEATQKVVRIQSDIELARRKIEFAARLYESTAEARRQGVGKFSEEQTARIALEQAKADLVRLEAELPLVLGKSVPGQSTSRMLITPDGNKLVTEGADGIKIWDATTGKRLWRVGDLFFPLPKPSPQDVLDDDIATKLKKALDTHVKVPGGLVGLPDVLSAVFDQLGVGGLTYRYQADRDLEVDLHLRDTFTFGATLQLIQDATVTPDGKERIQFVVREYGILVLPANLPVPKGAVTVQEFWKGNKTRKDPGEAKPKK